MLTDVKAYVKTRPWAKRTALWLSRVVAPLFRRPPWRSVPGYISFARDLGKYRRAGGTAHWLDFYPCLYDRSSTTTTDRQYFYQGIWLLKKIRESGALWHVDVASDVRLVGLLSVMCKVAFVDIRPMGFAVSNLEILAGTITALPFADESTESFSSMHVIEHIGLGRYGDPIDPRGPQKAGREISRIVQPKGKVYISVPVGRPRVGFNGLWVFHVDEVVRMFEGLDLVELSLVDAVGDFHEAVNPTDVNILEEGSGGDFGLGLFEFIKPVKSP